MAILDYDKTDLTEFQLRALDGLEALFKKYNAHNLYVQKYTNNTDYWKYYGKHNICIKLREHDIEIWIYHNEIGYECVGKEFGTFERVRGETDDSILSAFFESLEKDLIEARFRGAVTRAIILELTISMGTDRTPKMTPIWLAFPVSSWLAARERQIFGRFWPH